jgi:hypothetical protein
MSTEADIVEKKFWDKVDRRSFYECWPWRGAKISKDQRGILSWHGKTVTAPRASWEIHNGEMPATGVFVCHTCDNANCVNPRHLWLGDAKLNAIDAASKGRCAVQQHPETNFFSRPESNAFRPRGIGHGMSLVDDETVRWIRATHVARHKVFGAKAIGDALGLHADTISNIVHQRTWRHVG